MAESLLDAITGGLLGVAASDALGATVELMTPEEIEHERGVHREIIGGADSVGGPGRALTTPTSPGRSYAAISTPTTVKSSKASPGLSWTGSTAT